MPGESYTRSVKVFINGKEVENELKSVKAGVKQLNAEVDRLEIGSEAYNNKIRDLKKLNGVLDEHRGKIKNIGSSLGDALKGLGAISMVGAVTGVIAAVGNELNKGFNDLVKYSEGMADMAAVMDLSADEMKGMSDRAQELTTITTKGGTKIRTAANDILEGFKLVAAAKPELLQVEGALEAVTKEAIILSRASGEDLATSVGSLTTVMSQFNVGADEAARIINVLAAGSKIGAAETKGVAISLKEFGLAASNSNISIEESVGLIELLASRTIFGAEAGTKLRNILVKLNSPENMPQDAIDGFKALGINMDILKDKTLPLEARLRELAKAQGETGVLTKAFEIANIDAAIAITDNVDLFKDMTAAVTGTNSAYETAEIRSASLSQKLKNAGIWWSNTRLEVMQFLEEAVAPLIDSTLEVIDLFSQSTEEAGLFSVAMDALGGVIKSVFIIAGWIVSVTGEIIGIFSGAGKETGAWGKILQWLVIGPLKMFGDAIANLPNILNAIGAGMRVLSEYMTLDFSKNIATEMKNAFTATQAGVSKINKEAAKLKSPAATDPSGDIEAAKQLDLKKYQAQQKAEEAAEKRRVAALKKVEKQKEKEDAKEVKDLENQHKKLLAEIEKHAQNAAALKRNETENSIVAIREKYADEIATALLLESKGVSDAASMRLNLERLKEMELSSFRDKILKEGHEKMDRGNETNLKKISEFYTKRQELIESLESQGLLSRESSQKEHDAIQLQHATDVMAAQRDLLMKNNEDLLESKKEAVQLEAQVEEERLTLRDETLSLALSAVEKHYDDLLAAARKYGVDQATLDEIENNRLLAMTKATFEEKDRQMSVMSSAFGELGDAVSGFIDQSGKKASGYIVFQKAMTIAQIAFDTARAISSITAASTAGDPYTYFLRVATGVATILANIAKAKQLLSTPIPTYEQKKSGGYHDVIGADDGKRYRAEQLGRVTSGMLPSHPVTILASEDGPEYFVANDEMKKPMVASLVREIENIRTGRASAQSTTQMQDGGYSVVNGSGSSEGNIAMMALISEGLKINKKMNETLERGIMAIVVDSTVIDIQDRYKKLNEFSGGVLN